jgi:hypothetical protein
VGGLQRQGMYFHFRFPEWLREKEKKKQERKEKAREAKKLKIHPHTFEVVNVFFSSFAFTARMKRGF